MTQTHPIPPIYNENSKILILGSFPSVKSREQQFFYGHKQNRFWKVLAQILECPVPNDIEEKKEMLLNNHIALWDVIASCSITGSSDASITDVVPNDLSPILETAEIQAIYCNGNKAYELYQKYIYPTNKIQAIKLPSTSPANASYSLERLVGEWEKIINFKRS
jgi:hypoxanthine-DNA glycosylase